MDHKLDILAYALIGVATLTSLLTIVGTVVYLIKAFT